MIIDEVIEVLKIEAEGILKLIDRIDNSFVEMVDLIYKSKGRLIIGGIGKSGIVGRKIVATLNSTGTRSFFLHPVEAMHGDLGIVSKDDIFLALSNSGETDELNVLVPTIRKMGCKVISFTGNKNSTLAKHSDIVIDVGVEREACPLGLAPTASTTALLAIGDALAVALINRRDFKPSDFRKIHPGGVLGQRLSNKVKDIMITGESLPLVCEGVGFYEAILKVDSGGIGAAVVVKDDNTLSGIITDGDIRRTIAKKRPVFELKAEDVMTKDPRKAGPDTPAYDALYLMERFQITVLPITDSGNKILGVLHLHDILGKGSFTFKPSSKNNHNNEMP